MKNNIVILLAAISLYPFTAAGAASAEFSGERASGIGSAFCAYSGDITSVYSNPAGMASFNGREAGLGFGQLYGNGRSETVLSALNAWRLNISGRNYPFALNLANSADKPQSVFQIGATVADSTMVSVYPVRYGATLKYRTDTLNGYKSPLIDIGVQSDIKEQGITGGLAIKNLLAADDKLVSNLPSCGVMYEDYIFGRFSAEVSWQNGAAYLSCGWEYRLYEGLLMPRLGLMSSPDQPYMTFGMGMYPYPYICDFYLAYPLYPDKSSGRVGFNIRYRFDRKDFSELFLNRSIEKGIYLERKYREASGNILSETSEEERRKSDEEERRLAPKPVFVPQPSPVVQRKREEITWPQYHMVAAGDTLRSVSQRYYGDPNKWQKIYNVNTDKIDRGQPKIGQLLTIPRP